MATDIKQIVNNLLNFYNFSDKTITTVGAGGGQLIEYGRTSKSVYAVDNDDKALDMLRINLLKAGLTDKFSIIHSDFYKIHLQSDIVLFEFSLHEIDNPESALKHAQTLAPNIIILDHLPDSEWAFLADEKEKVSRSWAAIESSQIKKIQKYSTTQIFQNYEELKTKLEVQGENSMARILNYQLQTDISIAMTYGIVLL